MTLTNSNYLGCSYNEVSHVTEVLLDIHKADTFRYISEVTIHSTFIFKNYYLELTTLHSINSKCIDFLYMCRLSRPVPHQQKCPSCTYNTDNKHFRATLCYSVSKIKSVKIHRTDIVLDCLLNFSLLFIYPTLPNVRQIPL